MNRPYRRPGQAAPTAMVQGTNSNGRTGGAGWFRSLFSGSNSGYRSSGYRKPKAPVPDNTAVFCQEVAGVACQPMETMVCAPIEGVACQPMTIVQGPPPGM